MDFTYVENVVYGHILAAESLEPGAPSCGKVQSKQQLQMTQSDILILPLHFVICFSKQHFLGPFLCKNNFNTNLPEFIKKPLETLSLYIY